MGIPAVLVLVDGSMNAANGTVEARPTENELNNAVLKGHDGAQDPPVGSHDDKSALW